MSCMLCCVGVLCCGALGCCACWLEWQFDETIEMYCFRGHLCGLQLQPYKEASHEEAADGCVQQKKPVFHRVSTRRGSLRIVAYLGRHANLFTGVDAELFEGCARTIFWSHMSALAPGMLEPSSTSASHLQAPPLQELQKKGVSQEVCKSVLKRTFGDSNDTGIQFRDEREGDREGPSDSDWDRLDHDSGTSGGGGVSWFLDK